MNHLTRIALGIALDEAHRQQNRSPSLDKKDRKKEDNFDQTGYEKTLSIDNGLELTKDFDEDSFSVSIHGSKAGGYFTILDDEDEKEFDNGHLKFSIEETNYRKEGFIIRVSEDKKGQLDINTQTGSMCFVNEDGKREYSFNKEDGKALIHAIRTGFIEKTFNPMIKRAKSCKNADEANRFIKDFKEFTGYGIDTLMEEVKKLKSIVLLYKTYKRDEKFYKEYYGRSIDGKVFVRERKIEGKNDGIVIYESYNEDGKLIHLESYDPSKHECCVYEDGKLVSRTKTNYKGWTWEFDAQGKTRKIKKGGHVYDFENDPNAPKKLIQDSKSSKKADRKSRRSKLKAILSERSQKGVTRNKFKTLVHRVFGGR